MRQVFHTEHQLDYNKSYEFKLAEIKSIGWSAAHAKFLENYPSGFKPECLRDYYFFAGENDALLETFK